MGEGVKHSPGCAAIQSDATGTTPCTCGAARRMLVSAQMKKILGICSGCGKSIPEGAEGIVSTHTCGMFGVQSLSTHLCASCANGVANVVIGMRSVKMNVTPELLAEYRCSRLRELLPTNLFAEQSKRKSYHMKEILMLKPQGPRLLVKRIDAPKAQSSTIIIPDTVDGEHSCFALVLAIGNKVSEDIKVADTVVLAHYCGSPVEVDLDGETLEAIIVMQDDVLAVLEDGAQA